MELSIKLSASMMIAMIAAGSAVGEFVLWREANQASMQNATAFYQDQKIDLNTYVHGYAFPEISVENQKVRLQEAFDPKSWVRVMDAQDGDITNAVAIYGNVDNTIKGEYELRYVVRNSLGLKSTKRIKVIVD